MGSQQLMNESGHLTLNQSGKRERSPEPLDDDIQVISYKRRVPDEIIVIDDEDGPPTLRRGQGTKDDPITFTMWMTRNLIAEPDNGTITTLVGDESDEGQMTKIPWDHQYPPPEPPRSQSPENPTREFVDGFLYNRSCDEDDTESYYDAEGLEDDDSQSCIIVFEEIKPSELGRLPWTYNIKQEVVEEASLPDLTLSQDSVVTRHPSTPSPSQSLPIPTYSKEPDEDTAYSCDREDFPLKLPYTDDPKAKSTSKFLESKRGETWTETTAIRVRKQLFYSTYWMQLVPTLRKVLSRYHEHVQGIKDNPGCWLYRGPRIYVRRQTLGESVGFRHDGKLEKITINIAIVAMLLEGLLTDDAKEGIIENAWHASHLCGNWTCINPHHITVEPGPVNISRNPCFRDKERPCSHTPRCLKHLKVGLETLRPSFDGHVTSKVRFDSNSSGI